MSIVKNVKTTRNAAAKKNKIPRRSKTDRRIVRTRDILGEALFALMQEKAFDKITVQDLLDRAGVGRSTFYAHYRDKHDLLISDVEEFFEYVACSLKRKGDTTTRLLPVSEFFSHIRDVPHVHAALVRSGQWSDLQALAVGLFARSIDERFQALGIKIDAAQRPAHAHALAGSLFSLLDWWMDKGMKADPKQMDDLYHRLAWRGLS